MSPRSHSKWMNIRVRWRHISFSHAHLQSTQHSSSVVVVVVWWWEKNNKVAHTIILNEFITFLSCWERERGAKQQCSYIVMHHNIVCVVQHEEEGGQASRQEEKKHRDKNFLPLLAFAFVSGAHKSLLKIMNPRSYCFKHSRLAVEHLCLCIKK